MHILPPLEDDRPDTVLQQREGSEDASRSESDDDGASWRMGSIGESNGNEERLGSLPGIDADDKADPNVAPSSIDALPDYPQR